MSNIVMLHTFSDGKGKNWRRRSPPGARGMTVLKI